MPIVYHRNFKKMLRKMPVSVQEKFYGCLAIFVKTPHNSVFCRAGNEGKQRLGKSGDTQDSF